MEVDTLQAVMTTRVPVVLTNVKAMSFDSIICKNIKKKDAGLFREALKKVFFSNIS